MQATMAPSAGLKAAAMAGDPRAGKYLIFQLGSEEFGTNVLKVREIMKIQAITTVPQTPEFVKGVINLRGQVIPVMDLRTRFGMPEHEQTDRTCIVVVRTKLAESELPVGIVVDGVVEVLTLTPGDIEDTPDFGHGVATPYLLGMAKIKGRVKILLDMDQALCQQELQGLNALLQ
ncbi:MAG TPA: chemotaxis protein CheW [Acidobacteriaceae bacterium]|jgi:purine-binding chemotaxis protein CheW|nr:chemotaxis protein CheW [Acidobacteriaceae bacterium]